MARLRLFRCSANPSGERYPARFHVPAGVRLRMLPSHSSSCPDQSRNWAGVIAADRPSLDAPAVSLVCRPLACRERAAFAQTVATMRRLIAVPIDLRTRKPLRGLTATSRITHTEVGA